MKTSKITHCLQNKTSLLARVTHMNFSKYVIHLSGLAKRKYYEYQLSSVGYNKQAVGKL